MCTFVCVRVVRVCVRTLVRALVVKMCRLDSNITANYNYQLQD